MSEGTTSEAEVIRLRRNIETQMRRRILEAIELVLEEELTGALGTGRYERGAARRGYRNGHQTRRITTAVGAQMLEIPRGRMVDPDGSSREFRSQVLPRYARRTREVGRGDPGCLPGGREHASHPQGARAVAGRGASVEERGVAGGVSAQGAVPALERDPPRFSWTFGATSKPTS